jgi:hypothetical protein
LGLAAIAEAPDSVDRVDLAGFGFVAGLRVDLGFGSGSGVATRVCGPRLDLGEVIRFVGEGSSSEDASRVGDLFPFGFGFAFALGLGSDLAGDNEDDLTFIVPPVIGVPSTLSEVEPLARTSPPSS